MERKSSSHRLADYFVCMTSNTSDKSNQERVYMEITYRYPSIDYPDTKIKWANVHWVNCIVIISFLYHLD